MQWLIIAGGWENENIPADITDSTEILRFANNENSNWIEKNPLPKALSGLRGATLYGYFRVFGGTETMNSCHDFPGICSNDVLTWDHHFEEWRNESRSIDSTVYPYGIWDHAVTEASFTQLEDFCE